MAVLGVDGRRGRWIGALLAGRSVTPLVLEDVDVALAVPDVELIGIDMPIVLSDDGVRACDIAVRTLLGPAGSAPSAQAFQLVQSGTFGAESPGLSVQKVRNFRCRKSGAGLLSR